MRRLREFNLNLLEKWYLKLHVDLKSLWYTVLVGRYGTKGGRARDGGGLGLVWWR